MTAAAPLAFDHFVLVVRDVERSIAWYREHLGLDGVRVDEWRRGEAPFPSLRINADTIIDFIPERPDQTGADPVVERGHLDHICFVVTNERLAELRTIFAGRIVDEGDRFGARGIASSIYVHDPDGLTVELRAYPS